MESLGNTLTLSLRRKLRRLNGWYDSRRWPRLVSLLAQALPGLIFAWSSFDENSKSWLRLHPYYVGALLAVGVATILVRELMAWAGYEEELDNRNLAVLINCVDQIVGEKVKRFAGAAAAAKSKVPTLAEAFQRITQPDQQIAHILDRVWLFFNSFKDDPSTEIRVVLAAMGDEHIQSFAGYCPSDHPPRSNIEALQDDTTAFSRALASKRLIVVEDVTKEGELRDGKFKRTREVDSDDGGSLLCFPVTCHITHRTPYVLSVYATKSKHFTASKKKAYEYILSLFAKRLILENSLLEIKEAATS